MVHFIVVKYSIQLWREEKVDSLQKLSLMKDNGKVINLTAMENKSLPMEISIKEILLMA